MEQPLRDPPEPGHVRITTRRDGTVEVAGLGGGLQVRGITVLPIRPLEPVVAVLELQQAELDLEVRPIMPMHPGPCAVVVALMDPTNEGTLLTLAARTRRDPRDVQRWLDDLERVGMVERVGMRGVEPVGWRLRRA